LKKRVHRSDSRVFTFDRSALLGVGPEFIKASS